LYEDEIIIKMHFNEFPTIIITVTSSVVTKGNIKINGIPLIENNKILTIYDQ